MNLGNIVQPFEPQVQLKMGKQMPSSTGGSAREADCCGTPLLWSTIIRPGKPASHRPCSWGLLTALESKQVKIGTFASLKCVWLFPSLRFRSVQLSRSECPVRRGWQLILLRVWNKLFAAAGVKGLTYLSAVAESPGRAHCSVSALCVTAEHACQTPPGA